MPSPKEVVLQQLSMGQYLMGKFTEDLTDQEYFKPPTEGANHAAWIVGHIACSEDSLVAAITGVAKRIPDSTFELFKGGSQCIPDASKYPSRKQIDELFRTSRAHTAECLKKYDEARFDDPPPKGWDKELFPSMGAIWGLQGTHQYWHIGQLTVCRQALNKKHVLGT